MADIEIEIDGQKLTAKPDQTVIQVADEAGIYIPRFCYHKHLSIAANCRMCLVEVEKSPKALPACATPVMAGMKVFTRSQKTIDAQRAVMEFLLINHPLDCPICDQGGECELQDLAMGYGSGHSRYDECKRATPDQDIGPLIATEMTRCIYCTRCVRFGDEVAGMRELGGVYRGGETEITTFVKHAIQSEVSGNIIDLCPVGALTSKPYRFTARAWELQQAPSISPHDCWGSNLAVHTRYGKVMRVVSRENLEINQTWISDRDRFSYTGLYHADRIKEPMVRTDGVWRTVEWQEALELAAAGLRDVIAENGADKFGALASPNATLEEFYLLQKIVRGLGSQHVDHRLREIDTRDQSEFANFPGLTMPIADLEQCDALFLIGSNLQKELPLAALRVRRAALKGADVFAINPVDYQFNFKVANKIITAPHRLPSALASLVNAIEAKFPDVLVHAEAKNIAEQLRGKQKIGIIVGALAMHHPEASTFRYLAQTLAELTGGKVCLLTDGANGAGAWIAGAIPHRQAGGEVVSHPGLSAYEMFAKPRKGYLLLNVEPELDCANSAQAITALKQARFVVALSLYRNPILEEHADVILPIAPFTETAGTFINATGQWQSFHGVANTFAASRPAWKVLRVLGNFLNLEGFAYESAEAVKHEVKSLFEKMSAKQMHLSRPTELAFSTTISCSRIGEIPLYALDSLVRRATPLQATQALIEGEYKSICMHPETAKQYGLKAGDKVRVKQQGEAILPVMINERIPEAAVWIAGGIVETAALGDLFGLIDIEKA